MGKVISSGPSAAKGPSISAGPASGNDQFSVTEDQLAAGAVFFNVLANDPRRTTLYSLDNGAVSDLVAQDQVGLAEPSRLGNSVWITSDGNVGYNAGLNGSEIQSLAAGETLNDSFLYAIRQGNGSLLWFSAQVTITGVNDAPLAGADSAFAAEDALTTGSVALNDRDVDHGAVLQFAATGQLPAGFAMASNGSWTFDGSDPAYQDLRAGETVTFLVQYAVTDEHGASSSSFLKLTVTGSNDAPTVTGTVAGTATEGAGQVVLDALANASDVDHGAVLSVVDVPADLPAGVFYDPSTGKFTLDPAAYEQLAAGETKVVTVSYGVSDGSATAPASVSWTVTGTNDAPVAAPAAAGVAEDESVSGELAAADADSGAALAYTLVGEAPAGFTLNADGSWTFDSNHADYQSLAQGEDRQLVLTYSVSDEHGASSTSTLTLTVSGANDSPVTTSPAAEVAEGESVSGQLLALDQDNGAQLSFALAGDAPAGFSLAADGSWTLDASNDAYRGMADGETRIVEVVFTATDEHGASSSSRLVIAVTGTNAAPALDGAAASLPAGSEDSAYVVTQDQLLAGWADADGDALVAANLSANHGTVVANDDGSWWIQPDSDYAGPLTLSYEVSDGARSTPASLSLTLAPVNDAPRLEPGTQLPGQVEDAAFILTQQQLLAGWSDAEGAPLTVTQVVFNNGSATANADGTYSFTPAANFNGTASATVTVSDGELTRTEQVYFTIQSVNDPATITGTKAGAVTENQLSNPSAVTTSSGDLNSVDPDGIDDKWIAVSSATASDKGYGSFTVTSSGQWTYALDNGNAAVDSLSNGQTLSDSFTVQTLDGTAQVVTVVINGRTDFTIVAPTITDADPNDFDSLHSEGTQPGAVNQPIGSAGNDSYDGSDVVDTIAGSEGVDLIYGHGGNDYLYGGAPYPNQGVYELGSDTLYGQAGSDQLDGGNGADTLYGGSGNDWLYGENSPNGSATADQLYGGSGDDWLEGQGGNDTLVGGYGKDTISGGAGSDTFVYLSVKDSGDTLIDFKRSDSDKIDLSAIDANANLAGDQAFATSSAPAAYSVWMVLDGNYTLLCGDVDGDPTTAEFMVKLSGTTYMSGGTPFAGILL